jgi:hypothetical protein
MYLTYRRIQESDVLYLSQTLLLKDTGNNFILGGIETKMKAGNGYPVDESSISFSLMSS